MHLVTHKIVITSSQEENHTLASVLCCISSGRSILCLPSGVIVPPVAPEAFPLTGLPGRKFRKHTVPYRPAALTCAPFQRCQAYETRPLAPRNKCCEKSTSHLGDLSQQQSAGDRWMDSQRTKGPGSLSKDQLGCPKDQVGCPSTTDVRPESCWRFSPHPKSPICKTERFFRPYIVPGLIGERDGGWFC
jgi:hypothetical protein